MYAQTLRKWSPIKILMYLWLSVIIILVFWCPGALTMQLTPFRSIRSDDQQISPLITSSQQQQQQQQHYRQQPHDTEAPQRVTEEEIKNQQRQHSKIFSYYSNNNYNSNRNSNSNNNNNNNNNHNNNNLYKKINNLKIVTPNNSIQMLNHNVESGTHERIERISHSNDGENGDQRSTRTNLQHFLQFPPKAKPPQTHHQPLTNTTNNGLWLSRMNEKRVRIMAHRQHLQQMAKEKQQLHQPQIPSVGQTATIDNNKQLVAKDFFYPDYAGRNRRDSRPSSNNQQLQPLQQRPRQRRYCSARDPQTLAFAAPTVFEGKVKSMSSDRRNNFSVTFEVKEIHKKQPGYKVPQNVRLQFTSKTFKNTRECDIYREEFRLRGYVRDELEQGKVYFLFVNQIDLGNFTILGQPIKKTQKIENDVKIGARDNYGKRASIEFMTSNLTVREGRRVRLMCKVNGQPPPKVTWFKDGRSINRNRLKYNFIHLRRRSELIIKSATINDTGRYECRAKNKLARQPVSNFTRVEVIPIKYFSPTKTPISWVPSGSECPEKEGSVFCLNGGTCLYFKDVGEPACRCPDGFDGNRCETKNPSSHTASTYTKQPECGDKFYGGYYC